MRQGETERQREAERNREIEKEGGREERREGIKYSASGLIVSRNNKKPTIIKTMETK